MGRMFSVRVAGTMGLVALLSFTAGLVSFPLFPSARAALSAPPQNQAVQVNRALKSDRLPILTNTTVHPRQLALTTASAIARSNPAWMRCCLQPDFVAVAPACFPSLHDVNDFCLIQRRPRRGESYVS